MNTNCHNCGAPITGPRCEYCDTVFYEPIRTSRDIEKDYVDLITYNKLLREQVRMRESYDSALRAFHDYKAYVFKRRNK